MSGHKKLGTLQKNPVRDYWENEARDFTPWLADNINLLGEEIGLDLEVEAQESSVGSFRVDLLCRDENERAVIVENQLEQTNHRHLGQLLTYAAGKDAVAVVWVSVDFTEEHRAALDWLNDKTGDEIHFFGVQIEVWQIGNSDAAPKFEVVCKPNEWTKTVKRSGEMSDVQKLRFDYWRGLHEHMRKQDGKIAPKNPVTRRALRFSIGRTGFRIAVVASFERDWIGLRLLLFGSAETKNAHFHLLKKQKEEIEKEIGAKLEWDELTRKNKNVLTIRLRKMRCTLKNQDNWPELHKWHCEPVEKFYAAFHARVQNLNVSGADLAEVDDAED